MAILTVDTDEDGGREYIVNLDSDNQSKFMPKQKPFLEAEEAAATLGISRATLYAYVSRGLIRGTQKCRRSAPAALQCPRHRAAEEAKDGG
jgi:citrate synthase